MTNRTKIVIAGGTGFMGNHFAIQAQQLGFEVIHIARHAVEGFQTILWEDSEGMRSALENASVLINLAGKSVNCRYNEANKAAIFSSRTETTQRLGQVIAACQNPPALWINASTATIYRHAEDRPMTEEAGEIGSGFSVEVAKLWEKTFFACETPHTRKIALRIAIVLGKDGGVMEPYKNLVKWGLGGRQGSGKQKFSWIHVDEVWRIIQFLEAHKELSGVFNCASPNPVDNATLMRLLRKTMKKPIGLPSPKWLLKLGARMIGTETELILKSRWVIPEKLQKAGYVFQYPTLEETLVSILK